jgi:hypothetical protein
MSFGWGGVEILQVGSFILSWNSAENQFLEAPSHEPFEIAFAGFPQQK